MKKFKAVIFDFDGTLSTLTLNFTRMKNKVALLGSIFLEKDKELLLKSPLPVLEFVEEITREIKRRDPDMAKEFNTRCRLMMVDMEIKAAKKAKLFPYTKETISKFKNRGIRIGVITRNCTPAVTCIYPDIKKDIEVFVPREDVKEVKPSPKHLLKALLLLNVSPTDALYVGDHPIDIKCAKEANTSSAVVLTGIGTKGTLLKYEPDFIASNILELYNNLFNMGRI